LGKLSLEIQHIIVFQVGRKRQELAEQLQSKIAWMALINLVLAPVVFVLQMIYSFFRYVISKQHGDNAQLQLKYGTWSIMVKIVNSVGLYVLSDHITFRYAFVFVAERLFMFG